MLWIYWHGARTRDIRFERAVVEEVLATRAADPRKVVALLSGHKAAREAIAPWPRAPKPTTGAETKELEVMATPGVQ